MEELLPGLKVLADTKRLEMIQLMHHGEYCVGALAVHLGISSSAVSQHLRLLREADLVRGEKRGYWTHYQLNHSELQLWLAALSRWLTQPPPSAAGQLACPAREHCQRRPHPCP